MERSAICTPDKVGLICGDARWTYRQLDSAANRLGNGLFDHGVQRGDRVAILLPNSFEAVIAIFAILKAGAVVVPIHPSVKSEKLTYILNDCEVSAVITHDRSAGMIGQISAQIQSVRTVVNCGATGISSAGKPKYVSFTELQNTCPDSKPANACIDQDLACLVYTSGSTGQPKGVMASHDNMLFAASSITTYLKNDANDVIISALPLSFDYGLYQPLMAFHCGASLVLESSFTYPAHFLRRLVAEKATGFPGVPTMFALLMELDTTSFNLSHVRYMSSTGASLPPDHIRRLRHRMPQAAIYSMYGLTETKRTLYLPPEHVDHRPDSVGIAIPGTEVWLVDDADNRLGANHVGELVVRGRHVMRGYWGQPEATDKRFPAGPIPGERLCYTGDLFRMDSDGFFYFVSRKDDIIKCRGEKVAPKEVENVLYAIPGVVEAMVVGVPDTILGQAIRASVVCKDPTLTEASVIRHCREHLEDHMVPKYVQFLDSLPKTSSGKIQRCVES